MNSPYTTYKDFSESIDQERQEFKHSPMHKAKKIFYYIAEQIAITLLLIIFYAILGAVKNSSTSRYPSSRYRKVIKQGILWDNIEYHER